MHSCIVLLIWGTICPRGPNFCEPFVHGDRIGWGPFVQGDQFYGDVCPGGQEVRDRKSGDQNGSGPNTSQPNLAIRSETEYGEYEKKC